MVSAETTSFRVQVGRMAAKWKEKTVLCKFDARKYFLFKISFLLSKNEKKLKPTVGLKPADHGQLFRRVSVKRQINTAS